MIVRSAGAALLLITQPDHASLAGRIMASCKPLASCPRRAAVLHAIAEHDNGWAEVDEAPHVDAATGAIVDFVNAPLDVRHSVWPRGVARLAADPWAAALVAQHAIVIYERYREDAAWTGFFDEMTARRDVLVAQSGLSLALLLDDYPFVRLADLISLAFCTGWTDAHSVGGWTVQAAGREVAVVPDPFGGEPVPMAVTARRLEHRRYRDDADLRETLAHAEVVTFEGEVRARRAS